MQFLLTVLLSIALLSSGCAGAPPPGAPLPVDFFYSFEADFEGWSSRAIDVGTPGGVVDDWSVTRSQDIARDGVTSLKLHLANWNDAGKIFIEKAFPVHAGREYELRLTFSFASADFGEANLWPIIAGPLPAQPNSAADLASVFQDSTFNGTREPSGYLWLEKDYTSSVRSNQDASLYLVIGVWGTFEVERTYYVDSVHVRISEQ